MAYWLDDNWENGPMIRRAGTAAFGLYSVCGLWITRHGTDGFVPSDVAAGLGTREWAAKLVDAGLWESVEGGFRDPHYLKLNPSAEKVEERRRKEADRKARWRAQAAARRTAKRDVPRDKTRDKTGDTTRDIGNVPAGLPLSPTQPPSKEGLGDARHATRGAARVPDDWDEDPAVVAEDEERLRLEAEAAVLAIGEQQKRTQRGASLARAAIPKRTPATRRNALAELRAVTDHDNAGEAS